MYAPQAHLDFADSRVCLVNAAMQDRPAPLGLTALAACLEKEAHEGHSASLGHKVNQDSPGLLGQ